MCQSQVAGAIFQNHHFKMRKPKLREVGNLLKVLELVKGQSQLNSAL